MYKPLPEKLSYPELEQGVLGFWKESNIFQKSLEQRKDARYYSFYDGPATANGKPGIHHMIARTLKDMMCRYKAMQGYYVPRQGGWDTHGLPVEIEVEKKLGLSQKSDIEKIGIDKFNAECKKFIYENINNEKGFRAFTERHGYWVDLDSAYITCTNEYIESVWWALKQFFDKGLIYKGFKVIPQSPTIETPLSSHELSLGYREVRDPNVYLKLAITDSPKKEAVGAKILVWTTTPWTLFANVALAVGENIEYALVKNTRKEKEETVEEKFVIGKNRISVLEGETEVLAEFTGKELLGTQYEQIFPFAEIDREKYPNALTVLAGDFVSDTDGTGVVHMAPAFGVDDFEMSKKHNLPVLLTVTPNGHIKEGFGEFSGRAIKNFKYGDGHTEEGADKDIIIALKKSGKIFRASMDYLHSYPHCWRTDNPVMYFARDSWFIKSPEYKSEMIANNKQINWQPPEIGAGRFGNWIEEVKEWSLSRDRYWGTPLPIWLSEDKQDMFAVGSIEELMRGLYEFPDGRRVSVAEAGVEIDLHRPFVDKVVFERDGKTYRRTHEVIDVWFDSGAMPFAQMHYPFENKELFEKTFPADFIAEGIDQTRGWFYTLHNIATALFDNVAFRNVIVNEMILDKKGQKMSKSRGNTVDPFVMMDRYGADAVRWYLMVNNVPWKPTLFNEDDIKNTVIADFFRSLTNTYAFFALYANIDEFQGTEAEVPLAERPELDRWILSKLNTMLGEYASLMDQYEVTKALRLVQEFAINDVSNWYVRRNRRRFWKGEKDAEKIAAYQTLRTVLMGVISCMAPAAPFLADDLYSRLRTENDPESIHLCDLAKKDASIVDEDLERRMELAQKIVFLARSLREKSKIKTRQPLRRIMIPISSPQERRDIQGVEEIIREEINIKHIEYMKDDSGIVQRSARPNFKTIGKKFGKSTQNVANHIKALSDSQIQELVRTGQCSIAIGEESFVIEPDDVEIVSQDIEGWLVATEGRLTVALDTEIDEELIREGIAREFVNRIQNLRKSSGFEVTDRIEIRFSAQPEFVRAIAAMQDYIKSETLAEAILTEDAVQDATELDISDEMVKVNIKKIS